MIDLIKFWNAVNEANVKEVERFIEKGVDINIADATSGMTLLMIGAHYGGTIMKTKNGEFGRVRDEYRVLFEQLFRIALYHVNTNVNQRCKLGYTALDWATLGANKEAMELLLKHPKLDLETEDKLGVYPLLKAHIDHIKWGKEPDFAELGDFGKNKINIENKYRK